VAKPILEVDFRVINSTKPLFAALAEFSKKTVPALIKEKAGLFARYLAENTQPVDGMGGTDPDGGSLKARDLGRSAVRRDISKVYCGPGDAFSILRNKVAGINGDSKPLAKAFYALLKQGRIQDARNLLREGGASVSIDVSEWDNGAMHKQRRNKKGRVGRSYSPTAIGDKKALKAYIKKKTEMVGFAKAGWVNAAKQLGEKGLSKIRGWIKKHRDAPGKASDLTGDEARPRILLRNGVDYAPQTLDERQFNRTIEQFEDAVEAELKAKIKALEAKQNKK